MAASTCPEALSTRFILLRHLDPSGVSGTGHIADGVVWPDGRVSLHWRGRRTSTTTWDKIDDVIAVHGHDGCTTVEWLDHPYADSTPSSHELNQSTGATTAAAQNVRRDPFVKRFREPDRKTNNRGLCIHCGAAWPCTVCRDV